MFLDSGMKWKEGQSQTHSSSSIVVYPNGREMKANKAHGQSSDTPPPRFLVPRDLYPLHLIQNLRDLHS